MFLNEYSPCTLNCNVGLELLAQYNKTSVNLRRREQRKRNKTLKLEQIDQYRKLKKVKSLPKKTFVVDIPCATVFVKIPHV